MNTVSVFFAYAFNPKEGYYTQDEIVSALSSACSSASALTAELSFRPEVSFTGYGSDLKEQIETRIRGSGIVCVDISSNNANALYEMGFARALGLPTIVLKATASQADYPVPSNIAGLHVCYYDKVADLAVRIPERLVELGTLSSHISYLALGQARQVWAFGDDVLTVPIHIIAADSATPSEFRSTVNPDHIYLDNLCDKDSLVELSMLLARLYPQSEIQRFSILDYPRAALNEHVVLLGGIGTEGVDNNTLARDFCESLGLRVSYKEHSMIYDNVEYPCVFDKEGHLCTDQGLFGRFTNPWNKAVQVFLVQGIHTLGVLGAAKAFSLHPNAKDNNALIANMIARRKPFTARFPISILRGEPQVPQLIRSDIAPHESNAY